MENFSEIINGNTPVLVDFYATWCGPCKAMAPIIDELGKELNGKARILKIDVDKNKYTAAKYGVQSIPTLVIFKNGKVIWRHAGMLDKTTLISQINNAINGTT